MKSKNDANAASSTDCPLAYMMSLACCMCYSYDQLWSNAVRCLSCWLQSI